MEMTENSPLRTGNRGHYSPNTWPTKLRSRWNNSKMLTKLIITVILVSVTMLAGFLIGTVVFGGGRDSPQLQQSASSSEDQVLEIPQGKLKWNILQSRGGRDYYAFYKVPYAEPPLNERRFASPQPPKPWEGVRDEKEVAPQCIQKAKYSPIIEAVGEESCLFANIYTPILPGMGDDKNNAQLLPTLFYIHGGGLSDGNGSRYGGKYFMDEDVVLVTFQYRLGIFGFLSSEDGTISGNMGMKDQIQALKWVKENIKFFNGDPERIMIFGNSAGGESVNALMVSPMAAGLFTSAITQSGPAFNALVKDSGAQTKSYEALVKSIGCWSSRNDRVLRCLREQNASDIAVLRGPDIIFNPTVESYPSEDESDKFLPQSMYSLYQSGRVNKVPWMLGVNSNEFIHIAAGKLKDLELVENFNRNWTGYFSNNFVTTFTNCAAEEKIAAESKTFYFGEKEIGNETLFNLSNLVNDRDIMYGAKFQGVLMAELGAPVFLYYLSKRPAKSYSDKALEGYPEMDYGAAHADELQYLFDYYGYPEYPIGSKYYEFSKELVSTWVKFAATNNPGWDPIDPKGKPIKWYELNDDRKYTTVLEERMEFWDQFSPQELCYT